MEPSVPSMNRAFRDIEVLLLKPQDDQRIMKQLNVILISDQSCDCGLCSVPTLPTPNVNIKEGFRGTANGRCRGKR